MGELLTRLQAEEGAQRIKGYASRLLAALGSASGTPFDERPRLIPTAQPGINTKSLIEPLSAHELEVLRLLGTELSGPEIARERVVSLNTIRTQTQHIYAKLGVNNRRAAVRRAEELGPPRRRTRSVVKTAPVRAHSTDSWLIALSVFFVALPPTDDHHIHHHMQ